MSKGFSVSLAAAFLAAVPFASLPAAQDWRGELPRPVFDEKPELVDFYYKAWELAHSRIDEVPGLPAPRYMDEAHRSDRIWIWDTCFMALLELMKIKKLLDTPKLFFSFSLIVS